LTKNVKFKVSDDRYGIASVPVAQVIGATAIVVFNTKTRKIGIYIADPTSQVLNMKGSAIVGYDTTKSLQKTLRRPEQQLKELKAVNTQRRAQAWIDRVKTTATAATGRLNAETMVLKTWK
jgi:hypothetical protein